MGVLMRLKGRRWDAARDPLAPSGSLQEPDLILTVAVSRVGVAGHDERVVDAHGMGV